MARITVEDCAKLVQNRFELVALAAKRGKDITSGAPIMVERDNDKNAVIALRELAGNKLDLQELRRLLSQSINKSNYESESSSVLNDNEQDALLEVVDEINEESNKAPNADQDLDGISFSDDDLNVED